MTGPGQGTVIVAGRGDDGAMRGLPVNVIDAIASDVIAHVREGDIADAREVLGRIEAGVRSVLPLHLDAAAIDVGAAGGEGPAVDEEAERVLCERAARMFLGWPTGFAARCAATNRDEDELAKELAEFIGRHRDLARGRKSHA